MTRRAAPRAHAIEDIKETATHARPRAGGLPLRRMPSFVRPIVGWLMPRIGPRGLELARARVEMKAIETVIHLRRDAARKIKNMVPARVWALVRPYGLAPRADEQPRRASKP